MFLNTSLGLEQEESNSEATAQSKLSYSEGRGGESP